ncbi:MAG: histidine kinase [Bacteroidota bacterium]
MFPSRLQNQLLKKNIQPHFIMNTLTSLMEWVEEAPRESVHFIEALSKEFEVMSEIAEEQLIPIVKEVELCEHHVRIMRFRKEIDYVFETDGLDYEQMIPPAVIHTLVENALTHQEPDANNQLRLQLLYREWSKDEYISSTSFKEDGNARPCKIYELQSFGKPLSGNATAQQRKGKGGTGLKYIRSRLRESYGDNWKLESGPYKDGWSSRIILY